jgi:hypothetical protein
VPKQVNKKRRSSILMTLLVIAAACLIPGSAIADESEPLEAVPGVYAGSESVPGAPAGSCAAEPTAPRCPVVSEIIIAPPVEEETFFDGYGPTFPGSLPEEPSTEAEGEPAEAPSSVVETEEGEENPPAGVLEPTGPAASTTEGEPGAAPAATSPEDACRVHVLGPNLTVSRVYAHSGAENYCYSGVGVQYSEVFTELWKRKENGEIQERGSSSATHDGGGTTLVNHYATCNGNAPTFYWRAHAFAYSVVNGVGYGAQENRWEPLECN